MTLHDARPLFMFGIFVILWWVLGYSIWGITREFARAILRKAQEKC